MVNFTTKDKNGNYFTTSGIIGVKAKLYPVDAMDIPALIYLLSPSVNEEETDIEDNYKIVCATYKDGEIYLDEVFEKFKPSDSFCQGIFAQKSGKNDEMFFVRTVISR